MIQSKASDEYSMNAVAWSDEKGMLIVHRRKYIAENDHEKKLLLRFWLSGLSCNAVEAVIHMVCEVHVFKERL